MLNYSCLNTQCIKYLYIPIAWKATPLLTFPIIQNWSLHLRSVGLEDGGLYLCQVLDISTPYLHSIYTRYIYTVSKHYLHSTSARRPSTRPRESPSASPSPRRGQTSWAARRRWSWSQYPPLRDNIAPCAGVPGGDERAAGVPHQGRHPATSLHLLVSTNSTIQYSTYSTE